MIACGVSSSKITTASTEASAAENFGALRFGIDGAVGRLAERSHRPIAVDADDQDIAERFARRARYRSVARMKNVEDAVGEDDASACDFARARRTRRFDAVIDHGLLACWLKLESSLNLMFPPNDHL